MVVAPVSPAHERQIWMQHDWRQWFCKNQQVSWKVAIISRNFGSQVAKNARAFSSINQFFKFVPKWGEANRLVNLGILLNDCDAWVEYMIHVSVCNGLSINFYEASWLGEHPFYIAHCRFWIVNGWSRVWNVKLMIMIVWPWSEMSDVW